MHWRESERATSTGSLGTAARIKLPLTSRRLIDGFLNGWESAFGRPVELIVHHFERRLSELAMSVAQLGEGLLLLASPRSLQASSFHLLLNVFPVTACIVIFIVLGLVRIIALALNGHWMPYGAQVRAAGCVVGAFMWVQMAVALGYFNVAIDAPLSPGIPIYMTLALLEIVSVYRAVHGLKRWRVNGKTD